MKQGESRDLIVLGLALCLFSCPVWGLEVFDPDYEFETYAAFAPDIEGDYKSMTFGPDGNLYVTFSITNFGRDGIIYQVSPDCLITKFSTGLVYPWGIVWGGGTGYGDYFYVCDPYEREAYDKGIVVQIAPDGTTTTFAGPYLNNPISIEIDRSGIYGGHMYVGSGSWDRINTVSSTGETDLFYSIGDYSGGPWGFAFDGGGEYGNLMYAAMSYSGLPDLSGIIMFDLDGNPLGRLAPDIVGAYGIEFDEAGDFDSDMFVIGRVGDFEEPRQILRVGPDESIEAFAKTDGIFTFGPDGAMYVLEPVDGVPTVQRIYRVSFSSGIIRDIENVIKHKQRMLEKAAALIAKEQQTYDRLSQMLEDGDYGDFTKQGIKKAMKKLETSIAEQEKAISELEDSIFWLEKVLSFLGVE